MGVHCACSCRDLSTARSVVARGSRLRGVANLARNRRRVVCALARSPGQEVAAVTRHITVRLTLAQAMAASNACDLIRDSCEADGKRREAGTYRRAFEAIDRALQRTDKEKR